ncbi:family taurine catabolism dioxygenase [Trichoderma cornu-damae]|uniref:Family taurine catabolism dioxygenase n=1 Tax=Trichoderma cornu-damae TaxID=654480 RepID=A0A9P8QKN3_9HYPO|nr:family taurine catabolism dioxygenase [Trichoderma cornu-damae]
MASRASIQPIAHPSGSRIRFGAVVQGVDANRMSDSDFDIIEDALYKHQVLVFKAQHGLSSKAQYEIMQRLDPKATASYGHGKTLDAKRSILHPDLKTIPHQPQVQVIGNGFVEEYEGLKKIRLRHPHHKTFHATAVPEEDDLDFTRFYRWHIDAALYGLAPPVATSLFAARVPGGRTQTVRYEDTGEELAVPLGTTAFVSGYTMYDLLSPEDRQFVLSTKVEYAPHPYVWMSGAKSRSDGLGLLSEGKEAALDSLPEIEQDKIQILPMCWRSPRDDRLALQVHPSAVRKLHLAGGRVIDDLEEVREIVHRLQRPGIAPDLVYAHGWEEGDLVLFHNRSLLHSVVGAFAEDEVRLFRQCNIAASSLPEGPRDSCDR